MSVMLGLMLHARFGLWGPALGAVILFVGVFKWAFEPAG
jgi:hypothetical protein